MAKPQKQIDVASTEAAPQAKTSPARKKKRGIRTVFVSLLSGLAAAVVMGSVATHKMAPVALATPPAPQTHMVAKSAQPATDVSDLVAQVKPAIVLVSIREPYANLNDEEKKEVPQDQVGKDMYALGTGVIFDASGYIVTNHHVASNLDNAVTVTLGDGRTFVAKVVGSDPVLDLTVLKIDAGEALPVAKFGDSDAMRPGDPVFAIGNPLQLLFTTTEGIVSANHRDIGNSAYDDYIQTDASINPGNSGGPLFNMKGEVVGINELIFSLGGGSNGLGMSIPANQVTKIIADIVKFGAPQRATLGLALDDVILDNPYPGTYMPPSIGPNGVVGLIAPGGPAARAGIQVGDVVTAFDGKPVVKAHDLSTYIVLAEPGTDHTLTYVRNGVTQTVTVTLDQLKVEPPDATPVADKKGRAPQVAPTPSQPQFREIPREIVPVQPAP